MAYLQCLDHERLTTSLDFWTRLPSIFCEQTWIYFTKGCFVQSWNWLKLSHWFCRNFLKVVILFLLFLIISRSSEDALCQVLLKLIQRFWRKRKKMWKVQDDDNDYNNDNGQIVIRKAHLSLWLRWNENKINNGPKKMIYNPLIQYQSMYCILIPFIKIMHNSNLTPRMSCNFQFQYALLSSSLLQIYVKELKWV